jgi:hypothetical protein
MSNHVVDRETRCVGIGKSAITQEMQNPLAIARGAFPKMRLGWLANEGAGAAPRGEDAAPLELRIDLGYRVGIDAKIGS